MKTLFLSLLLFSTSAFAEYQWSVENQTYTQFQKPEPRLISGVFVSTDAWTTGDTYREVSFQILNVIDWGQTRYIAQHPDQFYESESAWLIGKNPDEKRIDIYMAESAVLHLAVSYFLPSEYRHAFQYITIGGKLNATIGNASIGIKGSF